MQLYHTKSIFSVVTGELLSFPTHVSIIAVSEIFLCCMYMDMIRTKTLLPRS